MSNNSIEKFERTLKNGVKLKNVPNTEFNREERTFTLSDYVSKNPSSWAYVPNKELSEEDVRDIADDYMYSLYQELSDEFEEVTLEKHDEDMFWADVTVEIPEDEAQQMRVAEAVSETILARQSR